MVRFANCASFAAVCLFVGVTVNTAKADAVADFYRDKQVRIVIAAGPGGGHSKYSQFMAIFLKKHMPGNPSFVVQHMGGAGGTKAANYLYNRAAQDGTAIGILLSDTPLASRLRTTGVKYVANKLQFLGGADEPRSAFVAFKNAGVKTLLDVRNTEVIMGSTGKGSQTFILPTLANAMLGTKFRVITGYRGMGGVYLAMDRGEVQGFQASWSSVPLLRADWIKQDRIVVLAANAVDPLPDLPDVPLLKDLVKDPRDKQIAELLGGNAIIGRAWLAPPGVPADRLAALRSAFANVFKDPEAAAAAKKRKMEWHPVGWKKQQAHANRITAADDSLFKRMRDMLK